MAIQAMGSGGNHNHRLTALAPPVTGDGGIVDSEASTRGAFTVLREFDDDPRLAGRSGLMSTVCSPFSTAAGCRPGWGGCTAVELTESWPLPLSYCMGCVLACLTAC